MMKRLPQPIRKKNTGWIIALGCLVVLIVVMLRLVTPAFLIGSGSMAPTLPIGTIVVTAPVATLQPTDIIAFRHNGKVITHTYLGEVDGKLVTHGDANPSVDEFDPALQRSDVVGKVIVAFTPIRMLLFVIIIIVAWAFWPSSRKDDVDVDESVDAPMSEEAQT